MNGCPAQQPPPPQNGCPAQQTQQQQWPHHHHHHHGEENFQPSEEAGEPGEPNEGFGYNGGQGMLNMGEQPGNPFQSSPYGNNYGYNPGQGYPQEGFGQPLQMGQQPGAFNQGGGPLQNIIGELEQMIQGLMQGMGMQGPQQSFPQSGQNGCPQQQQPVGAPQQGCQAQQPQWPQQPGQANGCPSPCQPQPPQQCCTCQQPQGNNPVGQLGNITTSGDPHNYDNQNGGQNIDPNSGGHWPTNAALFVNSDGSEVYEQAGANNTPVQNVQAGYDLNVSNTSQTTVYERNAQGQVVPLGTMAQLGWMNGNNSGQNVGSGQTVHVGETTVANQGGGSINITG